MLLFAMCAGQGACSLLCESAPRSMLSHVQQPDKVLNAGCRLE
jgi:hypothetical protein